MTRLPAGRSSTSMPGSSSSSSASVSRSRPSPPGKSVAATSWKCFSTAVERLGEARLDRLRQVVAQLLELVEALLEVGALHGELVEPLLLRLVLLLRERVDLAELLAALLGARQLLGELVAVLALGRFGRGSIEPPLRLVALGIGARELDVDRRQPLAGGARSLAQLDLRGPEPTERRAELGRAGRLRLGTLAQRRLEAVDVERQRLLEPRRRRRAGARARARSAAGCGPRRCPRASAQRRGHARRRRRRPSPPRTHALTNPLPRDEARRPSRSPPPCGRSRAARPRAPGRPPPRRRGAGRLPARRSRAARRRADPRARRAALRAARPPRPRGAASRRAARRPRRHARARPVLRGARCAGGLRARTPQPPRAPARRPRRARPRPRRRDGPAPRPPPRARRRRASSSSRTASAVSPANQSSPRCGSQPIPSRVTAGTVEASSSACSTTGRRANSRGSRPTSTSTEPSPAVRACSTSSSPRSGLAASTAAARWPSAAAVERSLPASTSSSCEHELLALPPRGRAPPAAAPRARRATAPAPRDARARARAAPPDPRARAQPRARRRRPRRRRDRARRATARPARAVPRAARAAPRRAAAGPTRGERRAAGPRRAERAARPRPPPVELRLRLGAPLAAPRRAPSPQRGLRAPLDRSDARPALLRLHLQPRTLGRGRLRGRRSVAGSRLELDRRGRVERAGRLQLGAQRRRERRRRLAPEREPLAAAAQPVERGRRLLARAGRVGQLLLGALALGDQRGDALVERAPLLDARRAPQLCLGAPLGEAREVERRDRRLQASDLDPELLRALGRGRLQRERAQALAHLVLEVARALDLHRDPRELQLGAVAAALEAAETGRLLDQLAPLGRLRVEHRLDAALRDHRAQPAAEADVREQLDEVDAADGRAVDEVLPLAAACRRRATETSLNGRSGHAPS